MERRTFLKLLTAITGTAALPSGFAESLPADVPADWAITIGHCTTPGEFVPYSTVRVDSFDGANPNAIVFPTTVRPERLTHALVFGQLIPLHHAVAVSAGIQPMFNVGALNIEKD